ncbi:MAG: hypothetical protein ACYC7A_08160 [Thermoanaerobaculia bacterium]
MWVFDGEEWVQEGGGSGQQGSDAPVRRPTDQEFYPELQIVEVPVVRRERDTHFPIPIP